MKFLITKSKLVKDNLIKAGFKHLPNINGNFYVFENVPDLKLFCKEKLQDGTYIFTNKMFL